MKKHIDWANKLFDMVRIEVQEAGVICSITNDNINDWKQQTNVITQRIVNLNKRIES